MSFEAERALDRIIALCEKSANPTMRQTRIYDIALAGVGLVSGQRAEIIGKWSRHVIQKQRDVKEEREVIEARRAIVMQKKEQQ